MPPAIEAFACFHPTDVKTYNISQHCPSLEPERANRQRTEVYILQQNFTHRPGVPVLPDQGYPPIRVRNLLL